MIISNTQSPAKSLYVIGGRILHILQDVKFGEISPLLLHREYSVQFENLSFAYISYALDWLFLAGCVELTDTGDIALCS